MRAQGTIHTLDPGGRAGVNLAARVTVEASSVFEAVLRWQRYLEVSGRANANTRRQYRRVVVNFVADVVADPEWTGTHDVFAITEDDLVDFISERTAAQGEARNMFLRAVRSFYSWCADRELVAHNPAAHLHPRKMKLGPAPSLSIEEVERLLKAATGIDPRARWAIQLQFATGCRISSLIALVPADVRHLPSGPSLVFREVKYDRPYEVPLGAKGWEAAEQLVNLIDYLAPKTRTRRPTLLGVGANRYRQWLEAAGDRAGVKVWTHLLRHTTATMYAAEGVDTRSIMELLNWETPAMLRRYAARSDANLRAAAI